MSVSGGGGAARAFVIGSGPNGLTAAITLARAGVKVQVFEASDTPGGGTRTSELTLPGFHHDVCSAVHPLAVGSPIFREFPLAEHGLEWIQPAAPLAHPLPDGSAVLLHRSIDETAAGLPNTALSSIRRAVKHESLLQICGAIAYDPTVPGVIVRATVAKSGVNRSIRQEERGTLNVSACRT